MGFFKLPPFHSSKKDNQSSWAVILKGAPDKKVEEALIRIFTERLDVPGDDALKVIRSAPIVLFSERTAREAEQIKLIFNKTGARTAISNDPHEFKKFPQVAWPKVVRLEDLGGGAEATPSTSLPPTQPIIPSRPSPTPSVFKSQKPVIPSAPKTPPPLQFPPAPTRPFPQNPSPPSPPPSPAPAAAPPPAYPPLPQRPLPPKPPLESPVSGASEEWKRKYETLQQSYRDAMDRLEKRESELKSVQERAKKLETEISLLQPQIEKFRRERFEERIRDADMQMKALLEDRNQVMLERDQIKQEAEGLHQEFLRLQELVSSLEAEKGVFETERERLSQERDQAWVNYQEAEKSLDELRREILQGREIRESLQREIITLRVERERPVLELEKIKAELERQIESMEKQADPFRSQLRRIEKLFETWKGPAKSASSASARTKAAPAEAPDKPPASRPKSQGGLILPPEK